jgi:hypothetical protein
VQYEQWRFPVLSLVRQSDVTAGLQITLRAALHVRK